MTDPQRVDDELVSAVLDGEATDEEQARVHADPVLAERLAEFEAVAHQVGRPVEEVQDAIRDQAIARALADSAEGTPNETAAVIGLESARSRRLLGGRPLLAAAAAVIGVLALAGGLLTLVDGGDDRNQVAGPADDTGADSAARGVALPELDLGSVDDPETLRLRVNETTGLGEQGGADDFESLDDQAGALEADDPETAEAAPVPSTQPEFGNTTAVRTIEDCTIELVESRPELIGQLAQGTVIYQGVDAYVVAYNDSDLAAAIAIVTSSADCTVLAEVPL